MRTAWLWALLCLGCVASAGGLVSTAEAQTDSGSDAEARRRFDEGRTHFDAGEFTEAANAFRRAYLLSPRYPLLYNIGQAELRAGHDAQALEAFEGFLRQAPADDGRRGEVEERVRVLRAMGVSASTGTVVSSGGGSTTTTGGGSETGTGTSGTETGSTGTETGGGTETGTSAGTGTETGTGGTASSSGDVGPAPWIVAGIGGAIAVTGGILMGVGAADAASVTGAAPGTMWSDIEGAAGRANAEWGAGIVLLGVGVAALGAGIVWGVAGGGGGESASARVGFGPGSVSVSGTF